jgi:thioredoxin
MSAPHFTTQDFDQKVLKSDKPVLVDFYATWCGPCQIAGPIIDKLSDELKDKALIGKVDVDQAQELAQKYNVMSIPTMIVFKDGKEVERKTGFPGEDGVRSMLDNLSK